MYLVEVKRGNFINAEYIISLLVEGGQVWVELVDSQRKPVAVEVEREYQDGFFEGLHAFNNNPIVLDCEG
jgi:hypothetical protein